MRNSTLFFLLLAGILCLCSATVVPEKDQEILLRNVRSPDSSTRKPGVKKKGTRGGKKKGTRGGKKKGTRGGKKKGTRGGKKKGTRGGKKKGTRKSGTPCPRQVKQMDDECLSTALKYVAAASGLVANLERQSNRIKSQNKTGSGKAEKKGEFTPLISRIVKAGGGNASALVCSGSSTGAGALTMKNLTDEIQQCQDRIFNACDPSKFPKPNSTNIEACLALGNSIKDGVKDCRSKKGTEACDCWKNETLATTFTDLKKCSFTDDVEKIKQGFKACKSSFGACRKLEDRVVTTIMSCKETPDSLKTDAKSISDNDRAVKAAQAKIDSLVSSTSKKKRNVDVREETCVTVISYVKKLTIYIGQSPRSKKIKQVALMISKTTVTTCSEDEKKDLMKEKEFLDSAAEKLSAALEAIMEDLSTSTGTTPSGQQLYEFQPTIGVSVIEITVASNNTASASNSTATNSTATG